MEILGVQNALRALSGADLIKLKHSTEFLLFQEFYNALIKTSREPKQMQKLLPFYRAAFKRAKDTELLIANGTTLEEFLKRFDNLCKQVIRRRRQYRKPLEVLLNAYDLFGGSPFDDLVNLFRDFEQGRSNNTILMKKPIAVGIIVIKPEELRGIQKVIKTTRVPAQTAVRQFYEGSFSVNKKNFSMACIRALEKGNHSVMVAYQTLVREYSPKYIVLLGVAGGIHDKVKLCDVVIADAVYNYDRRVIMFSGERHRSRCYDISARARELIARLQDALGSEEPQITAVNNSFAERFRVFLVPIGTGEAVCKKKLNQVRRWLQSINDNTMAVETEAAGASQQFYESQLETGCGSKGLIIIRGISDHANVKKNDDWQVIAAANATLCLQEILGCAPELADN
jgi:nucleoside phosphorylase